MRRIDALSYANPLRPVSAMWKAGFTAAMLLLSYLAHPLVQGLVFGWMSVWIIGYARIPVKYYAVLLGAPLVFFLCSLPALVLEWVPNAAGQGDGMIQGWAVVAVFHGTIYLSQAAMLKAAMVFIRIAASLSCFYFLILTTPFSALLQVMQRLKVPHLVLELMLITYRFIFLLYDTAQGIITAQRGRGGHSSFTRTMRDIVMLVVRLFAKTMQRYKGLSNGLLSRGFADRIHLAPYEQGPVGWRYHTESCVGIILLLTVECLLRWGGIS